MEKDNDEIQNHFSNEFTDKLALTKSYHNFFQNVQVKLNIHFVMILNPINL